MTPKQRLDPAVEALARKVTEQASELERLRAAVAVLWGAWQEGAGSVDHATAAIVESITTNETAAARMVHDYPALLEFFTKHALGPKPAPSCLVCGQTINGEPAIKHLELPGVVVCFPCRDAARAARETAAARPDAHLRCKHGWLVDRGETLCEHGCTAPVASASKETDNAD
jgi:hypothetical protein